MTLSPPGTATPARTGYFELAGPSLTNIAPRLLAGSKPGSSGGGSTGATPLPPYKTVICRSYHTKGKCFRAEPEKCWFVHELSEMRNFSGSSDTASFNQDHRAHSPPQPRRNFQISVGAGEKGKAPATPPPPVPVMQISPQQLVQTGKKPASADPRLYKTEMCRFYEATGMCRFGNACTFGEFDSDAFQY
ncbi:hypothetical protein BC830DRAFT_1134210 [Chytriomyces sp. MP71]|nr:hypothetical protein BC830DRAFT_1134210 [Chytriomyces sp. MP71]